MFRKDGSDGQSLVWSIRARSNGFEVSWGRIPKGRSLDDVKWQASFTEVVPKASRSMEEQINLEISSRITKQVRKGFYDVDSSGSNSSLIKPQKALKVKELPDLKEYPYWVQPKLDGIRGVVYIDEDGEVLIQSLNGKFFPHLDHLKKSLKSLLKRVGHPLDGELMIPGVSFPELQTAITTTKKRHPTNKDVEFNIFDVVMDETPLEERVKVLSENFRNEEAINIIPHAVVNSSEEMEKMFQEYLDDGYEGIMIRKPSSLYVKDKRKDLWKYKSFFDEEGIIVGAAEGKGKNKGVLTFKIKNPEGQVFSCDPIATLPERARLWKLYQEDPNQFIGKEYTYTFQERFPNGLPRFPKGKGIRDYE